ncbi:protein JINGUBANG-like [Oryza brachyantha]|uniref:protein JINGUBANG-like n=1 Tax=Oryza brachyantha TaxID=4533 RepID=UPI001AD9A286|nr:protein JINGUBANG-like [Oryza brachyantha]
MGSGGGGGHRKLIHLLRAEQAAAAFSSSSSSASDDDGCSTSSWQTTDGGGGSAASSPSRCSASTPPKSPWAHLPGLGAAAGATSTGLIASLVKEDGHVYSLAAAGDVLYTGTDSENVRVWRDRRELAGFRTGSGLVKAIVVADDGRIFTGHQDGKVRVWRADVDDPAVHRRVGSLPRLADYIKSSVNPSSYVDTRRRARRREVWLRHSDAVSCLSLDEGAGLLYSGSWDRTFKVWRVSDSKCLESVPAHDDAVNTVAAAGFDNLVFTGSADGTVKVWRREEAAGEATRHVLETVLRKDESAVTAIAVSAEDRVVYVGSSDGAVTYWHWIDGEARYGGALKGHRMAVMCLAVAGNVVVSGSADRTLCVWRRDGAEHHRLAVLAGHTGPVKCVAMDEEDTSSSNGERRFVVYSGSLDGLVKVWRLSVSDDEATTSPASAERERRPASPSTPPPRTAASPHVWNRSDRTPATAWPAAYQTPSSSSELNSVAAA